MKKGLNVQQKIQIFVITTTAIIFIAAIGYLGLNSKNKIFNTTKDLTQSYSQSYANLTKDRLNHYMDATRYLVGVFEDYDRFPEEHRRQILRNILKGVLAKNEKFLSVWSILKPGSIDQLDSLYMNQVGSTVLGNFRYVYYKEDEKIKLSQYIEQDPGAVLSGKVYSLVRERMRETIVDPYKYSYTGKEDDEILETNMVAPVIVDGEFIGVVGIDVPLETLQKMIDEYHPLPRSFAFLTTNTGEIVSFPEKSAIGKSIENIGFVNNSNSKDVIKSIQNGENFSFNTEYMENNYYVSVSKVPIGKTQTPWYVGLAIPKNVIMQSANKMLTNAVLVGLIGLILMSVIIWLLARDISGPIKKLTMAINKISIGNVDETVKTEISGKDEIAEMGKALNKYIDGYINKTKFASKIGEGDLNAEFELLSDEDKLGKSLLVMRESVKQAKEDEEKRIEEDKKRSWYNEGIAKFAELMRQNHDDMEKLGYSLISNIVEYLGANQGGVFILNDDDSNNIHYELLGAYAYNREKQLKRYVKTGVGLVGTCALEKKTIYLTEIPENYMSLQSGLGESNSKSLLIVPLKTENDVLGVLELASLKHLEDYQIEFVEKIAQSIASTLSSVRVNIKTNELLEKSQQQAEEMSAQEEEMRQNMEELQATQEEAARRETELKGILGAVDDFLVKAELTIEGKFIDVNNYFTKVFGYNPSEIKEKSIEILVDEEDLPRFRKTWFNVKEGETYHGKTGRLNKKGDKIFLPTLYAPIKDVNQNISKVLYFAYYEKK